MSVTIINNDALTALKRFPDESVHCVVTSPPYYGLRNYGVDGQIGLERTPEDYVLKLVEIFREVGRVLRNDGTLWLNLGDSYAAAGHGWGGGSFSEKSGHSEKCGGYKGRKPPLCWNLKQKDLIGIPWSVAFALRADGWWLRQDIIWAKLNPMPESVTDRCTKSHEYVFLLAKNKKYYFDNEAIKEKGVTQKNRPHGIVRDRLFDYDSKQKILRDRNKDQRKTGGLENSKGDVHKQGTRTGKNLSDAYKNVNWNEIGANKRSVWTIPTKPFKGAHFATFPPALVEPMIKAGTSEKGCCPKCGSPWERETRKFGERKTHGENKVADLAQGTHGTNSIFKTATVTIRETIGWRASCNCNAGEPIPATILDPFAGSGTVGEVAINLGRKAILIELNPKYIPLIQERCGMFAKVVQ